MYSAVSLVITILKETPRHHKRDILDLIFPYQNVYSDFDMKISRVYLYSASFKIVMTRLTALYSIVRRVIFATLRMQF